MFRFEELEIWKLSIDFAKNCYKIAAKFPREEFSLKDQLKRASTSPSNNVAEGSVGSMANFIKYINISIGSVLESVNIIILAHTFGFASDDDRKSIYEKAELLIKKLRAFKNSLR